MHVTAIFDIGKTNKKCILFDQQFKEVFRTYRQFEPIPDEDGFPSENLTALTDWIREQVDALLNSREFHLEALNFTTYGASLVHLDQNGQPLTPLYDYTKPLPPEIEIEFYELYGSEIELFQRTGSPRSGMLNSGLQLFWIKKSRPDIFEAISYSLHFPQYLSYLFTGIPLSEHTSIGCHTGLWDFTKKKYHDWVDKEKIGAKFPEVVSTEKSHPVQMGDRTIHVGPGLHDSSAALIPYQKSFAKPFLLISTGTWSICLNPFSAGVITEQDYHADIVYYLRSDGNPVKASRLFLGKEYQFQVKYLCHIFNKNLQQPIKVKFDPSIMHSLAKIPSHLFAFQYISRPHNPSETNLMGLTSFEIAYHQLMKELVALQIRKIELARDDLPVRQVFVDGGFADNAVFLALLSRGMPELRFIKSLSAAGTALGAAMTISENPMPRDFLRSNYDLQEVSI